MKASFRHKIELEGLYISTIDISQHVFFTRCIPQRDQDPAMLAFEAQESDAESVLERYCEPFYFRRVSSIRTGVSA